ncbi:uncharacterized protein [Panulirus ornatus]|uniref:uncharacterized protein n=1 Tax=Panulirus ornatus TaxID=150431 RepID=UPI003A87CD74
MTTMDEVFGNSSSETVMEAELSQVLANINQDIADLQNLQLQHDQTHLHDQQKTQTSIRAHQPQPGNFTTNVAHIVNRPFTKPYTSLSTSSWPLKEEPTQLGNQETTTLRSAVAHVPVITTAGKRAEDGPVPQPSSLPDVGNGPLRHTQSAVVSRICNGQTSRPRALSTGAAKHCHQLNQQTQSYQYSAHHALQEHRYVNLLPVHQYHQQQEQKPVSSLCICNSPSRQLLLTQGLQPSKSLPPNSAPPILQGTPAFPSTLVSSVSHTTVPKYMNIPLPCSLHSVSSHKQFSKALICGSSNSAPSTPRRGGSKCLHHSYIELWSGAREERDSLSDSECDDLKRSFQEPHTPSHQPSPGYVEMSSPYIKSPQVTSPLNGSVLADLATKLASYAGHQPRNIFCPFCPRYFSYEKSLGSHIHKVHKEELNSMVENRCKEIQLQFCPICQAQFFNTCVLPKHLIDFHRASVIEILEKNSCIMSDAVGIQCPFCVKKVPHGKTGEQVLLYHMQQLHLSDYEDMIKTKFQPYSGASCESLKSMSPGDGSQLVTFEPGVTSTPGLSSKLGTMTLSKNVRRSVEALNLDATWSSHGRTFRSPMPPLPSPSKDDQHSQQEVQQDLELPDKKLPSSPSKGILRHQSGLSRRLSVKRELRFSVPPVTSEEVFVPESPEQTTPEHLNDQMQHQQNLQQQQHQELCVEPRRIIPIRVDSLSAADFMDLNEKAGAQRKRRRLGLGFRSRKAFKKRDKENIGDREISTLLAGASKIVDDTKKRIIEGSQIAKREVIPTPATRTFRRPKPVAVPHVPQLLPPTKQPSAGAAGNGAQPPDQMSTDKENGSDASPFTNMKLYSPLRMFRCNSCRVKFCDNESLSGHIGSRHKGLLYFLRPQYGCGVCSARFFENKYLVKHCLQHHTSLLEIRSPNKHKITIYRFTHD